jgi:hypothetical protein
MRRAMNAYDGTEGRLHVFLVRDEDEWCSLFGRFTFLGRLPYNAGGSVGSKRPGEEKNVCLFLESILVSS